MHTVNSLRRGKARTDVGKHHSTYARSVDADLLAEEYVYMV